MRRIEDEAARMGLLVEDLLLLARLDQQRPLEQRGRRPARDRRRRRARRPGARPRPQIGLHLGVTMDVDEEAGSR